MVAGLVKPASPGIHKQHQERNVTIDRSRTWHLSDLTDFDAENGFRYEIIDGELIVTPAPGRPHGIVASLLDGALRAVLATHRPSWCLLVQPISLEIEVDGKVYHCEPDMSVFDAPAKAVAQDDSIMPVIVIEIVSPGNPENDYVRKPPVYALMGICEYWIVDPANRAVIFLALGDDGYELRQHSDLLPELDVTKAALFDDLA